MVSQKMFWKSSAKHLATRGFSQKGFVDLIFGHHRCPFSGNFSSLVQIRFRNITKLIYEIIRKKKSIMVTKNIDTKKVIFWTEIFWHVTHQNAYFLFYQLKRKICNLDNSDTIKPFHRTMIHATLGHEVCVHIFVLSIKQNICWHHKHFSGCKTVWPVDMLTLSEKQCV